MSHADARKTQQWQLTTNLKKKAPRVQPIPRVAPRVAPRIGFSHKLGRESHSESCSENAPEFRELLREWPFHSESVLFKVGVVPRFLMSGNLQEKYHQYGCLPVLGPDTSAPVKMSLPSFSRRFSFGASFTIRLAAVCIGDLPASTTLRQEIPSCQQQRGRRPDQERCRSAAEEVAETRAEKKPKIREEEGAKSGKKRSTNLNFWVRTSPVGWGSST